MVGSALVRKLLDVGRLAKLGWRARPSLEDGIRLAYTNRNRRPSDRCRRHVARAVIASEANQSSSLKRRGLLRRFAPRNDDFPHLIQLRPQSEVQSSPAPPPLPIS